MILKLLSVLDPVNTVCACLECNERPGISCSKVCRESLPAGSPPRIIGTFVRGGVDVKGPGVGNFRTSVVGVVSGGTVGLGIRRSVGARAGSLVLAFGDESKLARDRGVIFSALRRFSSGGILGLSALGNRLSSRTGKG